MVVCSGENDRFVVVSARAALIDPPRLLVLGASVERLVIERSSFAWGLLPAGCTNLLPNSSGGCIDGQIDSSDLARMAA